MEIGDITAIILVLFIFISLLSSSIIAFYRFFHFGKRITYIKAIKNKLKKKIVDYIFIAACIIYILYNHQNLKSFLLPSYGYLIFIIIINIISIPLSLKESIYECGIKTDSAFIKWSEISEITTDDKENRLLIYYKTKKLSFVDIDDCYAIEDYTNYIKNIIYDYWNKEKTKL